MSIQEQGIKGEKLARLFLKKLGFNNLMQLDWVGKKNGKHYQFEVKCKEYFKSGGDCKFDGHGLNKYQANARINFYNKTGIRCGFIVFDNGKAYYQWLDVLLKGEKFETRNGILIFPLKNFNVIELGIENGFLFDNSRNTC